MTRVVIKVYIKSKICYFFIYIVILYNMNNFNPMNLINLSMLRQTINSQQGQALGQNNSQNTTLNNVFESNPNIFTSGSQSSITTAQQAIAQNQAQLIKETQIVTPKEIKMENDVVQKYLQNLLKAPESLEKLIELSQGNQNTTKGYEFLKIFIQNMIDTKALAQLLNQNSKDAIQKLLSTISQSLKQSNVDVTQMKEILSILSSIQTTTNSNTNAIKELLLLYIPINYQVFNNDTDFSAIEDNCMDAIKNSLLSVLFETKSFANVLITINEDNSTIIFGVYANKSFPYDKFKTMVSTISKEQGVTILSEFKAINSENNGDKQNFRVISNDFVPTSALIASNVAIKTIFKLDNDANK